MPDPTPNNGRMVAPPTPVNNRPVNRAARSVLEQMKVPLDPSRPHLLTLLVEAMELADPGPGVPPTEWHDLKLDLAPLLQGTPQQLMRWWTSNPNVTPEEQEQEMTASLRRAETPQQAMWNLLEMTRDRLKAQAAEMASSPAK